MYLRAVSQSRHAVNANSVGELRKLPELVVDGTQHVMLARFFDGIERLAANDGGPVGKLAASLFFSHLWLDAEARGIRLAGPRLLRQGSRHSVGPTAASIVE